MGEDGRGHVEGDGDVEVVGVGSGLVEGVEGNVVYTCTYIVHMYSTDIAN